MPRAPRSGSKWARWALGGSVAAALAAAVALLLWPRPVAVDFAAAEVVEERMAPVGDPRAAVRVIVDHYELRGDWVIAMLGQELADARIRRITELGRQTHRVWVETVFSPQPDFDEELRDLLIVATDVYTWKLLRRDRGLDRNDTERSMLRLVTALLISDQERN